MEMFRQGDILLVKIGGIPQGLLPKDRVLANGETTGHKHQFLSEQALVFQDRNGQQFAKLKQECELIHEEHEAIRIPPGTYRVIRQIEFDIVEGIRQVVD